MRETIAHRFDILNERGRRAENVFPNTANIFNQEAKLVSLRIIVASANNAYSIVAQVA